ncbi:outer membrane lipoprotein carrier protein LolA [Defluviimonas sp. WL0050]|uniref:Outer membrane lipoprotein carrier protein LolA n=1 Tax=Albidovulum litorale TaxID=2984134 RepID=A0ABT2ZRY5_9RHOB|nr:outer membrane lipoprotein carrier protein LolA [Defluviimonas sp. WL0050]MCV2873802.1 outer membrane lipoprotein carrier protein LolA [Defluviimonas sp. WL0050]
MKQLRHILAPLALVLSVSPALAEKLPLSAISAYFNGLKTAETDFQQINSDGSTAAGRLIIYRPGRMRFEYGPPERTLVLASGGQVAIFDTKSNQPPEQYPLKKTPLNLILEQRVDLARAKMVVGHGEANGLTIVTAQDPEHPELGTIQMAFSSNPVALRQWIVTDETGSQTTVKLGAMKTGESYPSSLFSINSEIQRNKPRRN